jgi:hypothetical protein
VIVFCCATAGATAYKRPSAASDNESVRSPLNLTLISLICRSFNRLEKSLLHRGGPIQIAIGILSGGRPRCGASNCPCARAARLFCRPPGQCARMLFPRRGTTAEGDRRRRATTSRHAPPSGRANARPTTGSGGASSTPRPLGSITGFSEYWIARLRGR